MINRRLITFGCSYTYGDALPDCIHSSECPPSMYAWPTILGKYLHLKVVNESRPSIGNLEILWKILNFKFDPTDICIVMWSHYTREHLFSENGGEPFRMNSTDIPDKITKHWLNAHTDYDLYIRNWVYFHHANCYLTQQLSHTFHLTKHIYNSKYEQKMPVFLDYSNVINLHFEPLDFGADNSHPGIKSHNKLGKELFYKIKDKIGETIVR